MSLYPSDKYDLCPNWRQGLKTTFGLITSSIFNGFSIRKKFCKAETKAYSLAPSDLAYLVVDIVLSWFMSWFKQEMLCQSWW